MVAKIQLNLGAIFLQGVLMNIISVLWVDYFILKIIYFENFTKKKEKTTTDLNNQWSYLERNCAPECGEETVSFSDKETVTNIW